MTKWKETEIGEIPEDWEVKFLKDISDVLTGFPFKGEEYSLDEGILVVRGENLSYRKFRWDIPKRWRFLNDSIKKYLLKENLVVVSMDGNVGVNKAITRKKDLPLLLAQRVAAIIAKKGECQDFINQVIMSDLFLKYCNQIKTGTTINHISKVQIESFKILYPNNIKEQKAIAKILSDLDYKIELNNQMNATLEAMAQAIFKHWFIDFEFPDENGKPYKSSGGKMVDSELGKIPEGWKIKILKEISENFDSKRVPLSSRERTERKGQYPYFGATGILDYVDKYIFDGTYILMGEDGSVIDDRGYPILQYVWGKFWVNNHAHVLKGNGISDELLYILLKNTNVSHIITGAVQPKINQGNMNDLKYALPDQATLLKISEGIMPLFNKIKSNYEQIGTLTKLRDSLIPKLMSGQIRVPTEAIKNA